MRSKKAVSPLIATVLLIAFAVALGAVVMNWGRSYVEDTAKFAKEKSTTEIKCSTDVRMDFLKVKDEKRICYSNSTDPKYLEFFIENRGTSDIYGLQVNIIGGDEVNITDLDLKDNPIKRSRIYKMAELNYTEDINVVEQVNIIPKIKIEGAVISCPANSLEIADINECD
jgi:flagellin-like protein